MQSKIRKTQRNHRAAKHFLIIAVATLALTSCCKIRSQLVTVVKDGHLQTPEGKYPFEYLSYRKLQRIDPLFTDKSPAPKTFMIAEAEDFIVIANPAFGGAGLWRIYPKGEQSTYRDFKINSKASLYESKHNSKLVQSGNSFDDRYLNLSLDNGSKNNPSSITFYSIGLSSMVDSHSTKVDTFRYATPFSMNKKEYNIDVTIKFDHSSYIDCNDWQVPGSP
jgi:hypothetical protein